MGSLTEAEKALVADELAAGRDPRHIARSLGLHPNQLKAEEPKHSPFRPISEDGWGREDLRRYIVARRSVHDQTWPASDELAIARREYDAGLCELCTGRDGDWLILYKIPRQQRDMKRTPWLTVRSGEG